MTFNEIEKLQKYLRGTFGNDRIKIKKREQAEDSAEVTIGSEFIGVVYRDEDEGELSYAFHMAIIEEDLPS
ncbi:MAG: DUF3126 family protein [Sphingomonadales bacterium]|nr:DUF3126 family protein [Sphingomonadales bacterium]